MTLQAILIFLVAWMALGGISAIVTNLIPYTYDDTPKWPWLRRLVVVFYLPFLVGLCLIIDAMRCWDRDVAHPWSLRPMLRAMWRLLRQPLMSTANAWDL